MKLASPRSSSQPRTMSIVERPPTLAGLRIGFLDNTKAPVDKMLRHLEGRLRERIPGLRAFHVAKAGMGIPASTEVMDRLRQNADVVINALGD